MLLINKPKQNVMKTLITTLISVLMLNLNLNAQRVAYTGGKPKKAKYKSEKLSLKFSEAEDKSFTKSNTSPEFISALLPLVPTLFDLGVKITTNELEKKQKKYSAEYTVRNSKISEKLIVPAATVIRTLDGTTVFELKFQPIKLKEREAFFYYVESLRVINSKAFATKKSKHLDYNIELTPVLVGKDGEKKKQEISPITITGLELGTSLNIEGMEFRSDLIPLPKDSELIELTVKIVESNPDVIKIESIIKEIENYKDDAKTIINNFIEKDDNGDESADDSSDTNENASSTSTSSGVNN